MTKASAFELDALDSRIKELVAYARERDGEDRSVLYRNLVDLFLTGKAPKNDPTRSQLLDVLQALIPHVEAEARSTTCELVANMSNPPIDLVMRLVQDRARIVASLLTQVHFDDDDLIELIEKTGREHHQLVASREDLSANIWIALARAAPSAPPFDHNSTLALWSEDLGITQTGAPARNAKNNPAASTRDKAAQSKSKNSAENKKSATVTPLHRGRKAGNADKSGAAIRILRTDEDLVAARAVAHKAVAVEMNSASAAISAAHEEVSKSIPAQESIPVAASDVAPHREAHREAQDPGPGGWAWLSDRDGIVTSLSAHGKTLLGEKFSMNDGSMLDLLGLNAKLGHPVARAFQRRSAIHDAPIFLPDLEEKNRHWTLEATPYFSSQGGIFEGYEGILTPVASAANDIDPMADDDEGTALFLDDVAPGSPDTKPTETAKQEPKTFTDQASVFQKGILGPESNVPPVIEYARAIGVLKPTQETLDEIATDMVTDQTEATEEAFSGEPGASKTNTVPEAPLNAGEMNQDKLAQAASSVVKEVLAEALAPLEASIGGAIKEQLEDTETKAKASPILTSKEVSTHIAATFDLLEKALAHLTKQGREADDPQTRLQGEIASACVRSLKDHIC